MEERGGQPVCEQEKIRQGRPVSELKEKRTGDVLAQESEKHSCRAAVVQGIDASRTVQGKVAGKWRMQQRRAQQRWTGGGWRAESRSATRWSEGRGHSQGEEL